MAEAVKEVVRRWRSDNLLMDNLDFAYVFVDFKEAYSNAGRAVAVSWSSARILAEPGMITDVNWVSKMEGTDMERNKEELFLELDHAAAMAAAGYIDDGGRKSEEFLERRRLYSARQRAGEVIRRSDEPNQASCAREARCIAASLRQPGEMAEGEIEYDVKMRFTEPLAQLMRDCEVGREKRSASAME